MFGHDYAVPGTYEVTMVVTDRRPVFGEVVGTTRRDGEKPRLKPSALGQAVRGPKICPRSKATTAASITSTHWPRPSVPSAIRPASLCKAYAMHTVTETIKTV